MPTSYQPQTDRLMRALEQTWHQLFHMPHYIFSSIFFSHFSGLNFKHSYKKPKQQRFSHDRKLI